MKYVFLSICLLFLLIFILPFIGDLRVCYDPIYPAFDAPLVQGNNFFANYLYGNDLICFDMSIQSVRWRTKLSKPIFKIWRGKTNEIIVVHGENISSVNSCNGQIYFTKRVGRFAFGVNEVFGINEKDYLYYQIKTNDIICASYRTGIELWRYRADLSDSFMTPSLLEKFVFLCINPSRLSIGLNPTESERIPKKGFNKLTCLSTSNGAQLWEEKLLLSKVGFGSQLHLSSGPQYYLCVTENVLRLIEKNSGKVVKQWESQGEDIDGADFWKQDYVVVCLGGIGSRDRTIRVLNINDFSVYSEFRINAMEVASVKVVGDTLILESLYRNSGVDLLSGKKTWETRQWHYNVNDGEIFFGEYDVKYGIPLRILGKCDPTTGNRKILYSEMVGILSMNHRIWPLSYFIIIFAFGTTGIVLLWLILHRRHSRGFRKIP